MNRKLEKLFVKLIKLKQDIRLAIIQQQLECKHENISECSYEKGFIYTFVPLRVCDDCGLCEEGWGGGYKVLIGRPREISRDELYKARLGKTLDGEIKGKLLTKEITLEEAIRQFTF